MIQRLKIMQIFMLYAFLSLDVWHSCRLVARRLRVSNISLKVLSTILSRLICIRNISHSHKTLGP